MNILPTSYVERSYSVEKQTVFELLHSMDNFTNRLIIQWNKIFTEDLGISHILTLGYLDTNGKARPSQIAKELGLTAPTVTHLTNKLVKRQLVTRLFDENDRRIILLEITNEGKGILDQANKDGHKLREEMFMKLTAGEREQLLQIFTKLNET